MKRSADPRGGGSNRYPGHADGNGSRRRVLVGDVRAQADAIVAKYPGSRSAALPLLFLVQSVDGYVSEDGMRDVADILGLTPAEVLATASFYTMLKKRPQGDYLISVCRNISCTHLGARKVIASLEDKLGIAAGETTADGRFSLEAAECLGTCDGAPSMQVNYEDFYKVEPDEARLIIDKLAAGEQVRSVRNEPVKTSREIARETALAGVGVSSERGAQPFGGEAQPAGEGPGHRPKEAGGSEPDGAQQGDDLPRSARAEATPEEAATDTAPATGSPGQADRKQRDDSGV